MNAALLLALALSADSDGSKQIEQQAFTAVDEHRWCDAMSLFLAANAQAPAADLVYNAARAAELGGDRERAIALYGDVVVAGAEARRAEARRKVDAITRALHAEGSGTSCSPPPPPPQEPLVAAAPAETARSESPVTTASVTTRPAHHFAMKRATSTTSSSSASRPAVIEGHAREPGNVPLGFIALGAGGAALAVGAACVAIGAEPWVTSSTGADEAARSSGDYRWQAYGQGTVIGGAVLVATSAAALTTAAIVLHDQE